MLSRVSRLVVALLTFTCGVAATWLWPQLAPPGQLAPGELQRTAALACFPETAATPVPAACTRAYFPHGLLTERATPFDRYADYLAALNEPSLLAFDDCEGASYRLLWLRAFDPPVAIRVWRHGAQQFVAVARLDAHRPAAGYEPGAAARAAGVPVRPLSGEEWTRFVVLLNDTAYWTMPTRDPAAHGADGAEWVLEGMTDCRYHVVTRRSPQDLAYRAAGRYLVSLSGLDVRPEQLY